MALQMVSFGDVLSRPIPLIAAHGGAVSRSDGQNSLGALNAAIEAKVDLVELDVRRCRDGVFVVFRDPHVARMTAASGPLSSMSSNAVTRLQLRAGTGGPEAALTQDYVPLLTEALAQARDRVPLLLRPMRWADAKSIAATISSLDMADHVALSLPVSTALQAGRAWALRQDFGVSVAARVSVGPKSGTADAELILSFNPLLVHLQGGGFFASVPFRERLRDGGAILSTQPHIVPSGHALKLEGRLTQIVEMGGKILSSPHSRLLTEWRDNRTAA